MAISNTEYEVIPRAGRDADGYCHSATDFARCILGAGWQQWIYVLRCYGPSVTSGLKTAARFTPKPPANVDQQGRISVGFKAGGSIPVQDADGCCNSCYSRNYRN